jgi:hypothetical protein
MKPIPAPKSSAGQTADGGMSTLPSPLVTPTGEFSASNRRAGPACGTQRAYPWLLLFSTAVAALFCLLYITKPVIVPSPAMISPVAPMKTTAPEKSQGPPAAIPPASASLLPARDKLPGEGDSKPVPSDPRSASAVAPAVSQFEETNLRIQHVLTAEAPGGQLDRIILDVPVLYQSRNLRWTPDEVAASRELLVRLMDYQEKCRNLRAEGIGLLDAWNQLIERSIPATQVRADSPTLPDNQQDAADTPRPAGLLSTDSIQIQPSGK